VAAEEHREPDAEDEDRGSVGRDRQRHPAGVHSPDRADEVFPGDDPRKHNNYRNDEGDADEDPKRLPPPIVHGPRFYHGVDGATSAGGHWSEARFAGAPGEVA
jgi:hypothetical protein